LHFYGLWQWCALVLDLLVTCGFKPFVLVLCPFSHGGSIFPLTIYKALSTCLPEGGPAARLPLWLLCRCASGGPVAMATDAQVSAKSSGDRLPWQCYPSGSGFPPTPRRLLLAGPWRDCGLQEGQELPLPHVPRSLGHLSSKYGDTG
jgi:hypothetical protein